jgi:hypothetical protein
VGEEVPLARVHVLGVCIRHCERDAFHVAHRVHGADAGKILRRYTGT